MGSLYIETVRKINGVEGQNRVSDMSSVKKEPVVNDLLLDIKQGCC